ncbi:MAG: CDP-diacylglycerol--glycerol-3-phosphate 3-phosphatidyltransferase [Trizodia sp. TS-e1964]|nr:MAG: CDP-diacylglycerol--glycerol-3-phosphate 3-phosphatidyltransferase [Trizodia sp. TS-e1964]
MIIVRSIVCPATQRLSALRIHSPRRLQYSTAAVPSTTISSGWAPSVALSQLTSELDQISPRFDLKASQIEIIQTPLDFYKTLKSNILNAKSRIYLSTLYIGKEEHELISTIRKALKSQPGLQISFLTDALRGTRESPEPSCASLLAPLITEFGPKRVEIRLYHTPNLTGLRKRHIPKRINEGWGLQHMKLYGIDDEIIISGANLSSDYFENRQDRYHVFSSKDMTNYFERIHNAISSLSYLVQPNLQNSAGYDLVWPATNPCPAPLDNPREYIIHASSVLKSLIQAPKNQSAMSNGTLNDTIVYPLAQFSPLLSPDNSTEYAAIKSVLTLLSKPAFIGSRWVFTAGYFNPVPEITRLLLATKLTRGTVITASPWANGFYGSNGVSGLLPPAYTLLSRRFLERVQKSGKSDAIELKEWRRGTVGEPEGWTYHAKGLWIALPEEENPSITLVGSSNYTKRSYSLDLEINALVITKNEHLKARLGNEVTCLQKHAEKVDIDTFTKPERRVGVVVRLAMWIVGAVGGAL